MPAAIKLQEEHGDAIQVIFVECQGTPKDVWEAFAWNMKWMGNNAMWTVERPIPTVSRGLPEAALIGIDGTILMQGHPGSFGRRLSDAISAELDKARRPPEGTPRELERAWQFFRRNDLGAALTALERVSSESLAEEVTRLRADFIAQTSAQLERVKILLDGGHIGEAERILKDLEKSAQADPDLEAAHSAQKERLSTPEITREREAERAYARLVDRFAKRKPFDRGSVRQFQALAERYEGTKTAARAARILALSEI